MELNLAFTILVSTLVLYIIFSIVNIIKYIMYKNENIVIMHFTYSFYAVIFVGIVVLFFTIFKPFNITFLI